MGFRLYCWNMGTVGQENVNPEEDMLSQFEQQNISMYGLIKTLLSKSTMPHIILITVLSAILYLLARSESLTVFAAVAFTSMSIAYAITAMLSKSSTIQSWVTLPEQGANQEHGYLVNKLGKFKVCIFPLIIAVCVFGLTMVISGENGVINDGNKLIPIALGMLFIIWSIVQGTSFAMWASSSSAKQSANVSKLNNNKSSLIVLFIIIGLTSLSLSTIFFYLDSSDNGYSKSIIHGLPFVLAVLCLTAISLAFSWKVKKLAATKPRLQKFSNRWTLICHLFIMWHLLTIWRQGFLMPSGVQVFLEEISLMIFTVFIAIWSMTSKGYKSKFRIITEQNALTWGLAFGYAYAGSVAMLTTFFDEIKTVMMLGHGLVILTVLISHKVVLTKIISHDNTTVDVKRIVNESKPAQTEIGVDNQESSKDEIQSNENSDSTEVWQEDVDVDWDAKSEQPQIDNVEWDEVIEID